MCIDNKVTTSLRLYKSSLDRFALWLTYKSPTCVNDGSLVFYQRWPTHTALLIQNNARLRVYMGEARVCMGEARVCMGEARVCMGEAECAWVRPECAGALHEYTHFIIGRLWGRDPCWGLQVMPSDRQNAVKFSVPGTNIWILNNISTKYFK